jgi:hypothetical protein
VQHLTSEVGASKQWRRTPTCGPNSHCRLGSSKDFFFGTWILVVSPSVTFAEYTDYPVRRLKLCQMKRVTRRALVKQVIRLSDPDADDRPNLGRYDVSLRHVRGSDSSWWVSLDTTEDLLHALELDKPQGFTRLCARVGGRCVGTPAVIPDATTSGLGSKEISRASSSRATLSTPVKTETPLDVPAKPKSPTSTENGDTNIPIQRKRSRQLYLAIPRPSKRNRWRFPSHPILPPAQSPGRIHQVQRARKRPPSLLSSRSTRLSIKTMCAQPRSTMLLHQWRKKTFVP